MYQISAWNAHPCFFAKKSLRGLVFLLLPPRSATLDEKVYLHCKTSLL